MSTTDVSPERLRLAERLLIGAAEARPDLLCDDNWQAAMKAIYQMLRADDQYHEDGPYGAANKGVKTKAAVKI